MNIIKKVGKKILCQILENQVTDLRAAHNFKVIAVVGSVGKTSTKLAVAHLLGTTKRVRFQEGNYNDRLTVPLIFFGKELPGLFDLRAWKKIVADNRAQIAVDYPYDYVVVELGTDGPGQIAEFSYIKPDIAVVTAVTPEHMEYFGSLDAVAKEELTIFNFADEVLLNIDDTPEEYLQKKSYMSYGLNESADYSLTNIRANGLKDTSAELKLARKKPVAVKLHMLGKQGALVSLAAAAVADMLGLSSQTITKGLLAVCPFAGRMQILPGIKKSKIIDDSYNATPIAVIAGLDVLYEAPTHQRIAILGSMNELGDFSPEAHKQVGEYCDPKKLDLVATIGADAANYLAPVAKKQGCQVKTFDSPYAAGRYVADNIESEAVILVKGSQNRVFAEEAIKPLLANNQDRAKLVRQSAGWMAIKQQQFTDYAD